MKKSILNTEIILIILATVVLAALSAGKLKTLRAEAAAAATKDNMVRLQDAVNVYRWEHENRCPEDLNSLVPAYIEAVPPAYKNLSAASSAVKYGRKEIAFDGQGGWLFDNAPQSAHYCEVSLNI